MGSSLLVVSFLLLSYDGLINYAARSSPSVLAPLSPLVCTSLDLSKGNWGIRTLMRHSFVFNDLEGALKVNVYIVTDFENPLVCFQAVRKSLNFNVGMLGIGTLKFKVLHHADPTTLLAQAAWRFMKNFSLKVHAFLMKSS